MMALIFGTLFIAALLAWARRPALASVAATACFALAIWLFLFEIYSPATGFRMPWIRT